MQKTSNNGKYLKEKVIKYILNLFALFSIVTTFLIVLSLFAEALPFFAEVNGLELIKFGRIWDPKHGEYPILPIFIGTMMIVVFSCLIAMPLGLGCAIFLSEYAPSKVRMFLKPMLEILAGIPSVVYGFFALLYITPFLKNHISIFVNVFSIIALLTSLVLFINLLKGIKHRKAWSTRVISGSFTVLFFSIFLCFLINMGKIFALGSKLKVETFNVLSASFAVGIMITPLIASLSEDALKAVPNILREAALGLGSTKFETISKVTVPAAFSGIVSSFILAISRAIGETMVVAMAAGSKPELNFNPLKQVQTMTGYMVNKTFGEVVIGSLEYRTVFVVGMILFFITLSLNIIAKKVSDKFKEV